MRNSAGSTKPHIFSWILWTLLTWIAFAIQAATGAGPGAWATCASAILTTVICALSLRRGEKNITRSDWVAFILGLLTIPLWIALKDPTASALLVTLIDAFGFYPTIRKSWHKPHEELASAHIISALKHALSLLAITVVSIPTAFYPAALFVMNLILIWTIWWKRRVLKP